MTLANAPICLFVFNRPDHTRKTLEALSQNPGFNESPLIVFCDGARNESEAWQVEQTREVVRTWPHPDKTVVERDENWGLSRSIIQGVTQMVNEFGRIIVLEDDMVTSPYFLRYMNDALHLYERETRVASIHAYIYPIDGLPETFFLRGADCWGWATWANRWAMFEADGSRLMEQLKARKLAKRFDYNWSYPFTRMLEKQISGQNDSWAIRWHASTFLAGALTLYPGRSLVRNIGVDGSGTHCRDNEAYDVAIADVPISIDRIAVEASPEACSRLKAYFKDLLGMKGMAYRLIRSAQCLMGRI